MREGMKTRHKRLLRLEGEKNESDLDLTKEQIKLLEKANPCFRECCVESLYLGHLPRQDTFKVFYNRVFPFYEATEFTVGHILPITDVNFTAAET
jgi:hypothetical protein